MFLDPKKSVYNPELFEKYENERMFKFINRSSHEIYAKYIIDHQKINMKTTFRERDASLDESDLYYETDLLFNRDNYVAKTRNQYETIYYSRLKSRILRTTNVL